VRKIDGWWIKNIFIFYMRVVMKKFCCEKCFEISDIQNFIGARRLSLE
jgi:hypothetical protein